MAQPFFPHGWRKLRRELKRYPSCVVFLDYDGTLTRVVRDPHRALLSDSMRGLLERLTRQRGVYVGILSGRKLQEIHQLVRVPGIFYAGSHGFELGSRGQKVVFERAERTRFFTRRLAKQLSNKLQGIPGVWVEDKGLTFTVHYRRCRASDIDGVLLICDDLIRRWRSRGDVRVTLGKKVYEVRPAIQWDKGRAMEWFLRNLPVTARNGFLVYLGDDTTDEDAFRIVRKKSGWTIRVGPLNEKTEAFYGVRGIGEVRRFLMLLLKELQRSWKISAQKNRFASTPAST